jgi:hypothetical protein
MTFGVSLDVCAPVSLYLITTLWFPFDPLLWISVTFFGDFLSTDIIDSLSCAGLALRIDLEKTSFWAWGWVIIWSRLDGLSNFTRFSSPRCFFRKADLRSECVRELEIVGSKKPGGGLKRILNLEDYVVYCNKLVCY